MYFYVLLEIIYSFFYFYFYCRSGKTGL